MQADDHIARTSIAVMFAVGLAIANVIVSLVSARYAVRRATMNDFLRIVVGGIALRGALTLSAFGVIYARMASDRFIFALAFIVSYAGVLFIEVLILHRSQQAKKPMPTAQLTRREQRQNDTQE